MYPATIDKPVVDEQRGYRQRGYAKRIGCVLLGVVRVVSIQMIGQTVDGTEKFARESTLHLLPVGIGTSRGMKSVVLIEQQAIGKQTCEFETASC